MEYLITLLSILCLAVPLTWVVYGFINGKTPSPVEPIWIFIIFIFIGVNIKVFYIQFFRPADVLSILSLHTDRMLQGGGLEVLLPGLVGLLVGIIFFMIGYSINSRGFRLEGIAGVFSFNTNRIKTVVYLLMAISVISFVSYFWYETAITIEGSVIRKRFNALEGGSVNRLFEIRYYLYKFSTIAKYAFYLVFIYFVFTKKCSIKLVYLLLLLFVISISVSTYFGNRAHTLVTLFDISVIIFLNCSKRNLACLAAIFVLSFGVILATTIARQKAGTRNSIQKQVDTKNLPSTNYGRPTLERGESVPIITVGFKKPLKETNFVKGNLILVDSLSTQQYEKLASYNKCRELISIWKNHLGTVTRHRSYWGKRAYKIAPPPTGKPSWPVRWISEKFPTEKGFDICTGGIDIINDPEKAKPLSPFHMKLVNRAERFLQGRYFLDVLKTTHIIRKVPSEMGYLNGQSLIGWAFAPVPSSVWPEKPLFIQIPAILGAIIFTEYHNNIPPGIVAELFLNFGWTGIIIGMFVVGYLLRLLYNTLRRNLNLEVVQVLYAMIMVRMTVILFNTSFGAAMLKSMIDIIPLLIILWFVNDKKNSKIKPINAMG